MAMAAGLRPMNLGEILDRTFEIYRKHFLLFVEIAALPAVVMVGLHAADIAWVHTDRLIQPADRIDTVAWYWFVAFGYSHIAGFLAQLILPAFVCAGSDSLFGERVSLGASLRYAVARWRSYLWIAFLKLATQMLVPEALALGLVALAAFFLDKLKMLDNFLPMGAIVLLILAGAFFLMFWVGAWMSLSIPAAALEGLSGFKAVRRSWVLSKKTRLRIIATWAAILICSLTLQSGVQTVIRWTAILFYRNAHYVGFNRSIYTGVVYLFYGAIHAVVGPLYPLAITLFYYDQRVRKEGYDVEKMMEAAGLAKEPVLGEIAGGAEPAASA
jgi:hypothetical protein